MEIFVKDFSGTINLLQTSGMTGSTVFVLFTFFPTIFFHLISSESMSATVFKFCIHNEDNQVYYCKQNQGC